MKKVILFITIIICSIASSNAQEQLHINTSKSELKWFGENVLNIGGHHGIVHFKEGHFIKTNDKIIGGSFTINMNTIASIEDNKAAFDSGLVKHLKNKDFFDVEKFPIAKLVIMNTRYQDATNLLILANLTIRGISLPIEFKANINFKKRQMTTKFQIDRTRWGINYESQRYSFSLKDKAISDVINFEVKLSL